MKIACKRLLLPVVVPLVYAGLTVVIALRYAKKWLVAAFRQAL